MNHPSHKPFLTIDAMSEKRSLIIRAVLFDFDGTVTQPGSIDFMELRRVIGCPPDAYVLEYIQSLDDPVKQTRANIILEEFEARGAMASRPNSGAQNLIHYLHRMDVPVGIITRNSLKSVELAMANFDRLDLSFFDIVITRDDPVPPKPSPDGIHLAARKFNVDVEQLLMVGDFTLDIQAGRAAHAITAHLLQSPDKVIPDEVKADITITDLMELKPILRGAMPLGPGKLPADLLASCIDAFLIDDPDLLVKPGIGEDCAAVDVSNEDVMILTSDPITFATDAAGVYGVLVNANDIATAGAFPRWMLANLMFPDGTTGFEIQHLVRELHDCCRQYGITLCGGHTEITDAVNRPVISGMIAGTVKKGRLLKKTDMATGDRILLTKGVAVEGTAIIAREFGEKLRRAGMPSHEVDEARGFLSQMSILEEARLAAAHPGVKALHDVTEGGLATALQEFSIAGGHGLKVEISHIPILPQTETICALLALDPLGLIGSGSLLICCRDPEHTVLMQEIQNAGIPVAVIGKVGDPGNGITAVRQGQPATWPRFEVDEIARLFAT